MNDWRWLIAVAAGAYVLGSVPFGLLVGRMRGVDVTRAGSGNIGAANVARLTGARWGVLVFVLDVLKGLLPTLAAGGLLGAFSGAAITTAAYALWFGAGCFAILGHVFPLFLKFRGGKGVATGLGVVLGVYPYLTGPALVGWLAWGIALGTTGYFSVGSLSACVVVPIAYWVIALAADWPLPAQWPLSAFIVGVCVLVAARHARNIRRLLDGTEPQAWWRTARNDQPDG